MGRSFVQRSLEIWGGLPFLYVLLILSDHQTGFWTLLLGIMLW
jgi:ABC-type microcin C transport system permease subunit YejE